MIPYLLSVPPGTEVHAPAPSALGYQTCIACAVLPKCFTGGLGKLDNAAPDAVIQGRRRIGRHQSLYNAGDRQPLLFQVRYGQFKIVALDPMGEPRVIGFYMAGDMIGIDALATGRHQYRVVALEDSEVCESSYAGLEAAMTASLATQRKFIQSLGQAAIVDASTATFMSNMRCDQRLGYFLLTLASRYAELGYSSKSFRLNMSRADIGSYLGITPESVSRLLGRFKHNGWISLRHRDVVIADRDQLLMLLRADPGHALTPADLRAAVP